MPSAKEEDTEEDYGFYMSLLTSSTGVYLEYLDAKHEEKKGCQ